MIIFGGKSHFYLSDTVGDALISYVEEVLAPEFYEKKLIPEDCFPMFWWNCTHSPESKRILYIDAVFDCLPLQHYYFVVKSNDPDL